jgi:hypothetical protein
MTTPNLTPADAQTPRILWGGGECPAHPDAVVVVEWRNGRRSRDVCAVVLDWRHLDDLGDIVAFWVISSPDPDDIARYQPAVEPKRATPRPLRLDEMEHPMQPIGLDDDEVYRLTPIAADPDLARTVIALHARLARTEAELGVVTGENLQMRAERSAHKALRRKAEAERDEARRERDIQAETARKMAANVAEATEERDRLARILAARGEVASSLTSDERLPADEMQAAAAAIGRWPGGEG